jgi:hypothetical protein
MDKSDGVDYEIDETEASVILENAVDYLKVGVIQEMDVDTRHFRRCVS